MDILSLVKDQLTTSAVNKIGSFLGEDSAKTTTALAGAIPTILGGIVNKAESESGAADVMKLITEGGFGSNNVSNFANMIGGGEDTNNLVSSGAGLLSSIFGNKLGGIVDAVSKIGGISSGSSSSLLSMVTPLVMGVIGNHVSTSGLNANGLSSLLGRQKDSIKSAMPSGFGSLLGLGGLGSLLGGAADTVGDVVSGVADTVGDVAKGTANLVGDVASGAADIVGDVASGAANVGKKVVGGAADIVGDVASGAADIVGDVASGAANVGKKVVGGAADLVGDAADMVGDVASGAANVGKKVVGGAADLVGDVADTATSGFKKILPWLLAAALALGALMLWKSCQKPAESAAEGAVAAVDSTANNVADAVKKTLSTGVELSFGAESIENEMISFIENKDSLVNKNTWFNFRNLKFETGSAKIDSTSMKEVQNISEILKAFPAVKSKIGGYTDNVGNAKMNQKLSNERAINVMNALVGLGIDKSRLTAEGYGQEHPVASNDTEEGKAQNRRIAVRITEK